MAEPGAQMQRKHVPGTVAGKCDLPRPTCLGQQQLHAGDHPLERTFSPDPDVERRVLPQHDVMLEKHRHAAVEPDVQHRHEFAVDAVVHTRGAPVGDGGRHQLRWFGLVVHRSSSWIVDPVSQQNPMRA